jgi:hypothetical protein
LAGDTIVLNQGTLSLLTGSITIDGSGLSSLVTISGNHASTVFATNFETTSASVELCGLIITAGNGVAGGAIRNGRTALTVKDCILSENSAVEGAGIYNLRGNVAIIRSILSDNSASQAGGGIFNHESLGGLIDPVVTIVDSELSGNSAGSAGSGGAIYNDLQMAVSGSTLSDNSAGLGGGDLHPLVPSHEQQHALQQFGWIRRWHLWWR